MAIESTSFTRTLTYTCTLTYTYLKTPISACKSMSYGSSGGEHSKKFVP